MRPSIRAWKIGAVALIGLSAIGLAAVAFLGRPHSAASPGAAALDDSRRLEAEYEAMRAAAEAEARAAETRQNEELNQAVEALLNVDAGDGALPDGAFPEEPAVQPATPAAKAEDPGPVRVFSREIY